MPELDLPAQLVVSSDGTLTGNNGIYSKHLGDMRGVYRDSAAYDAAVVAQGADALVYRVESQDHGPHSGALTIGTSRLLPGRYGEEFAVTRGHLHEVSDRAELYYCLSGRGVMLLDTIDGRSEAVELTPGSAVNVPGEWVHRSVNVGDEPFVTLFTYATDAGQDYQLIADAGGMRRIVVTDGAGGWTLRENADHVGYRKA
ncbi:cupin domain-containing protein [Leucobacter allii]|uniref:glucose-6-phosphate isomerase n=1 Tax=Leucobacter allii TaxID=2932247 RepID=A0ABY4FNL1_9MICO|nr:glucose-6-phosphate isomerase family protein [Leucobacter allii]UOQ57874.1 cupin domain-containing protein [Leucobacter allii]UOR02515.1 cupin domain-containing protein [Leucobacter allii]